MKKTQTGFAIIESLLILIIIATIGGVGLYAIHTKNQTDKILAQADKTSQSTVVANRKQNNSAPGYLNIKEWGVRLRLSSQITDIYYTISGSDASLGLKSLDNLKTQDGSQCQPDKNSVVLITRYTSSDYKNFLESSGYENTAIHVGNYDYLTTVADPPTPLCSYNSNGVMAAGVNDKIQAEIAATSSLGAIPQ